jgi:hypothetical protein
MSESRSKSDKAPPMLPAPRPRPQIPSSLGPRLPAALARLAPAQVEKATSVHKFDKAFPVILQSDSGVANGVGRNISPSGMFIETREPLAMGAQVRVTFSSSDVGAEITALAEVRFQSFLNFAGADGDQEGMRGMGVRFLKFEDNGVDPALRGNPQ